MQKYKLDPAIPPSIQLKDKKAELGSKVGYLPHVGAKERRKAQMRVDRAKSNYVVVTDAPFEHTAGTHHVIKLRCEKCNRELIHIAQEGEDIDLARVTTGRKMVQHQLNGCRFSGVPIPLTEGIQP